MAIPRFRSIVPFGLQTAKKDSIPLQNVSVAVTLIDFLAEVTVEQTYKNLGDEAIEATYKFPLDSQAVIKAFQVEIDGRVINGQVQETQEAKDTYDDAIASGHGAVLVQQDQRMRDVFTCSVGNLPPKSTAIVRLTYVAQIDEEVNADDGSVSLRLVVPTAVAPRYEPVGEEPSSLADMPMGALGVFPDDLLKITGTVVTGTRIVEVSPVSHAGKVDTEIVGVPEGGKATFTHTAANLTEDFVLSVKLADRLPDRAWVQGDAIAVSVGLKPDSLNCQNESLSEYIFVIDRSGSMGGSRIKSAREALSLCVSSLPVGSTFDIVGFGSTHQRLFGDKPAVFDDASKDRALKHCEHLEADMGGTEILQPLQAIAATAPSPDKPRQVFVITDGEVSNTAQVIDFVRQDQRKNATRYFSFGIGSGASRELVKGIAEAGQGYAEFIVEGERIQGKIMQQMNRALQPALTEVRVDFGDIQVVGDVSPKKPRPLFSAARLLFFALVDPASLAKDGGALQVTLRGRSPDGDVAFAVSATKADAAGSGSMIKALAARALLKDLEDEYDDSSEADVKEAKKGQAVALSKSAGVVCRFTSLVAVDEREGAVTGPLKAVRVPLSMGQDGFSRLSMKTSPAMWNSPVMPQQAMFMSAPMGAPMAMAFAAPAQPRNRMALCSMPAPGAPPGDGLFGAVGSMASGVSAALAAPFAQPMRRKSKTAVTDMEVESDDDAAQSPRKGGGGGQLKCPPPPPPCSAPTGPIGSTGSVDHVAIVRKQKATGEWVLDDWLAGALGKPLAELMGKGSALEGSVWATALVLVRLRLSYGSFRDEWEAAERKARRWLDRACGGQQEVDGVLAMAEAALV